MEGLVLVKVSDLEGVLQEVRSVKQQLFDLQSKEDLKTYSVIQTAKLLNFSYNTVRKLIREKKLVPRYADEKRRSGKCCIPAWSIKEFLLEAKGMRKIASK